MITALVSSAIGWYAPSAFALRPFVSTDADVVDVKEWEIEFGIFGLAREDRENEIITPSLRFNYGILRRWELVTEFDVQVQKDGPGRATELKDAAVFMKGLLREGALQKRPGLSFAVEVGVLLPSTVKGERQAGLEGIGIVSGRMSDVVYHVNFGAELNREDRDAVGLWGVIFEYPAERRIKVVVEVNGEFPENAPAETSGLIGLTGDAGGVELDVGLRRGFSGAADDWGTTAGITFTF